MCLAVFDQCFPWDVIIEPVVELHAASLNCTVQSCVESTEDQSSVSPCCVVSGRGTSTEKSHGCYTLSSMVFLSPMRNEHCTLASIAPNPRRFEGLLLVFDSDYSGASILAGDDHLSGMRPACKQLYFLGHLLNHIW